MNEISKTCFTLLFCLIIAYVIELTHKIPEEYEEDLNKELKEGNIKKIQNH